MPQHLDQLGRRHARRKPHDRVPGHLDVQQHARDFQGVERHRFLGSREVEVMAPDENVDHVKIGLGDSVHFGNTAVRDGQAGLRVVGAIRGAKTPRRILGREAVETKRPLIPDLVAFPTVGAVGFRHDPGSLR